MDATPFLQLIVTDEGAKLPSAVLAEIFSITSQMLNLPADCTVGEVADNFEGSVITIGHTPAEVADLLEWYTDGISPGSQWNDVKGGQPVAQWRSGVSSGCTQELFLMPDGKFIWTEP